jgi:hypothetical protein
MAIPLELVDRYATTFLDFWRLRPRKFLPAAQREPAKYITPLQFLTLSLGLVFTLLGVGITLSLTALQSVSGSNQVGDPKALAARQVVLIFFMLVVGALAWRITSVLWPVRGRAPFRQILELSCYWMAVVLPLSMVDVLVVPILTELVARQVVPAWISTIPFLFGLVFGTFAAFFYVLPGVAYLNGVSSLRQMMGTLLWSTVAGFVAGFVVSFVSVLAA